MIAILERLEHFYAIFRARAIAIAGPKTHKPSLISFMFFKTVQNEHEKFYSII